MSLEDVPGASRTLPPSSHQHPQTECFSEKITAPLVVFKKSTLAQVCVIFSLCWWVLDHFVHKFPPVVTVRRSPVSGFAVGLSAPHGGPPSWALREAVHASASVVCGCPRAACVTWSCSPLRSSPTWWRCWSPETHGGTSAPPITGCQSKRILKQIRYSWKIFYIFFIKLTFSAYIFSEKNKSFEVVYFVININSKLVADSQIT